MTWKSTVALSGTLAATWLGWSTTPTAPGASGAAAPVQHAITASTASGADIQQQAARLHVRVRDAEALRDTSRNPFRFAARRLPAARRAAAPVAEPPPPLEPALPPPPPFRLAGIADDRSNGGDRLAILSTPVGVLFLKEGESVGDAYRVRRIGDDVVEIERSDGSPMELRFGR